ncbi:MAG TPA: tetratricopeptide repeat protein, partial [Longimicrobiales bacterium]|nr:tetratricopeptide repeat protein [Longimicrobiales bacterium]
MSEALQQEIRHLRTLEGSARDPRDRIFLPLADAHLRLGELDRARELLEDGLTRHPDFVSGHVLMARLHEEERDLDQAEERWATARRLDPQNADVLLALGRILVGRGESLGGQLVLKARAMDPTAGGQEPDADLVSISDLAPGLPAEVPVVSIADLAPDVEPDVVSIADLAPTDVVPAPTPTVEAAAVEVDAVDHDAVEFDAVEDDAVEDDAPRDDLARDASPEADPAETGPQSAGPEIDVAAIDTDVAESDVDVVMTEVADAEVAHAEGDHAAVDGGGMVEMEPDTAGDGRVVTRTLAELFAAQGQRERAVEMYEELVSRTPGDDSLRARLTELRSDEWDAAGAQDEAPADAEPVPDILEVPAEADAADEEEFDPRLSPAAPEPEVSTPFAWTASGEAEDDAPDAAES